VILLSIGQEFYDSISNGVNNNRYETVTIAVSLLILLVTLVSTERHRSEDRRPRVIVSFLVEETFTYIQAHNAGVTPALNLQIHSLPPLRNSSGTELLRNSWRIQVLLPGETTHEMFDVTDDYFGYKYLTGRVIDNFEFFIKYQKVSGLRRTIKERQYIDLAQLHWLSYGSAIDQTVFKGADEQLDQFMKQHDFKAAYTRAQKILEDYGVIVAAGVDWDGLDRYFGVRGWKVYINPSRISSAYRSIIAVRTFGLRRGVMVYAEGNDIGYTPTILAARMQLADPEPRGVVTYTVQTPKGPRSFDVETG
jgi:hypothetical protein